MSVNTFHVRLIEYSTENKILKSRRKPYDNIITRHDIVYVRSICQPTATYLKHKMKKKIISLFILYIIFVYILDIDFVYMKKITLSLGSQLYNII